MADLNRTTAQRLEALPRHLRFWNAARRPVTWLAKRMFNFTCDDLTDVEGPYLLLCNHNTNFDPILVGLTMQNHAYFVASEHVLHGGLMSRLLMRYLCPIIHQKGAAGLRSAKEIQQTLKAGHSVVLFPEGNRSFAGSTMDIPPVTAKMAKKAGKLVTLRFEGGYLTQPRWSLTRRKGRMACRLVNVYDAEALAAMSDAEVQAAIVADLREDAWERQEAIAAAEGTPVEFAGKNLAEGMPATLFLCPQCRELGTLQAEGSHVSCACGYHAEYLPTGFLQGGTFPTVGTWDAWQHEQLDARIAAAAPDEVLFSEPATITVFEGVREREAQHAGQLTVTRQGFTFAPTDREPFTFTMADLAGLAVYGRNTIVAHVGKPAKHVEVCGDLNFNALKYLYTYQALQ